MHSLALSTKNKRSLLTALATLCCFTVLNIFIHFWQESLAEQRRSNLLQPTTAVQSDLPNKIRFDLSCGEDLLAYWGQIPNAKEHPLVILSGMSQMYAINDRQPGDQTIVEWLDDQLEQEGVNAFGLAAPNMCNEEALMLLLSTIQYPETKPASFVYGVCFDKFRNVDLRPGLQKFIKSKPELISRWNELAEEKAKEFPLATEKMKRSILAINEVKETQEGDKSFEASLREKTGRIIPVVSARTDLNAWGQSQLFLFRNWVLRIKPTSKRPQIKSRYQMNQQFLELMIQAAQANKVQIMLYVIPLNPLAENPYIPAEYEEFKQWLNGLAKQYQVPFANLENIVTEEAWGEFMGGPDFKHFRGAGHKKTAQTLIQQFGPLLTSKLTGK